MFFEGNRDILAYHRMGIDNICATHFHRSAEILYVVQGEKRVEINGVTIVLQSGDTLFCPPYTVHRFLPSECSIQTVVTILPEYCEEFEAFCMTKTPRSYTLRDEDGKLRALIDGFLQADNPFLRQGIASVLFGVFVQKTKFSIADQKQKVHISQIASFVEAHCTKKLSLHTVANEFGYSPTYFSALFKKSFHMTFPQYLNAIRIQKSLPLLKKYKNISSVYGLCGFNSPQQFFVHFKKIQGCTPHEYLYGIKK